MISRLILLGYHHDYRYNDGVVAFPVYRMFKLNELDRVAITAEEIQYPSSPADNFFSDKFFSSFLSRIEPRTTPDVFTCFGRSSQQPDLRQYVILVPQKTLGVWAPPFSTELAQWAMAEFVEQHKYRLAYKYSTPIDKFSAALIPLVTK